MTDDVRIATATRYILLAEELTQRSFEAPELTAASTVAANRAGSTLRHASP
jgi:phosphoribosylaminoimidazole-succinocarboxamide synthase